MSHPLLLLALLQQLAVEPFPAEVGEPVAVRATIDGAARPALQIDVVLPDGGCRTAGTTDDTGELRFVATAAGEHRFTATIDGVRVIAPFVVLPERRRWPYALVCVPLGLALLLRIRRSGPQPSPAETARGRR